MRVAIENLTKRFGRTAALRGVSLEIDAHELFFLLGPSGCGKTTLLRLIAGFYQPDEGTLRFGDRPMQGVPPHLRNTGMVFQNYALWPHMSVAENVGYGLDVRAVTAGDKRKRVAETLEIVQLGSLGDRLPNQLSGGQQQRVALARALVIRPDVLLLDEPLSNLDAKLRLEMREEIRRIHRQTRITTIYVTHDQKEALSLASRLAILRDGVIEQIGDPRTVYRLPANRFVADFIGETNWMPASVTSTNSTEISVMTECGAFTTGPRPGFQTGDAVLLGFRPESVQIGPSPEGINNLQTLIRSVSYLGEIEQYLLEIRPGLEIKAFEQNPIDVRAVGTPLPMHVRPQDCLVIPRTIRRHPDSDQREIGALIVSRRFNVSKIESSRVHARRRSRTRSHGSENLCSSVLRCGFHLSRRFSGVVLVPWKACPCSSMTLIKEFSEHGRSRGTASAYYDDVVSV